jgi:hypothetical protein
MLYPAFRQTVQHVTGRGVFRKKRNGKHDSFISKPLNLRGTQARLWVPQERLGLPAKINSISTRFLETFYRASSQEQCRKVNCPPASTTRVQSIVEVSLLQAYHVRLEK